MHRNFFVRGIVILILALLTFGKPAYVSALATCTHFVSTTGNNANPGTQVLPWKTFQKAANSAKPGNVICLRAGVYTEVVTINVSGSASGGVITFQSYPGETAILDGSALVVPNGWAPLIRIRNKSYLPIQNLEIRNYRSALVDRIPIGIMLEGYGSNIQVRNNQIHHIETNYLGINGGDAHGIAVYGTAAPQAWTNIIIASNNLHHLKLGSSESLVINGNVTGWQVVGNRVHDNNNIGIDAIGFEGTSPDPNYDQARNGLIRGNLVYNIDSSTNPAYSGQRSADCIYVDGGRKIVIERNTAHHCNIGMELASEHSGRATSDVTLRNNFIFANSQVGIAIGGYDTARGRTERCYIINNTLYNNDTNHAGGGELLIQYDTRSNVIKNNIFYANTQKLFISSWSNVMTANFVNYNMYYVPWAGGKWQWKNIEYSSFSAYKNASGNDANSFNQVNPLFVNLLGPNLHLQTTSPAINRGETLASFGALDIDGNTRLLGPAVDLGADEVR
jgi:hypothetical protein